MLIVDDALTVLDLFLLYIQAYGTVKADTARDEYLAI